MCRNSSNSFQNPLAVLSMIMSQSLGTDGNVHAKSSHAFAIKANSDIWSLLHVQPRESVITAILEWLSKNSNSFFVEYFVCGLYRTFQSFSFNASGSLRYAVLTLSKISSLVVSTCARIQIFWLGKITASSSQLIASFVVIPICLHFNTINLILP